VRPPSIFERLIEKATVEIVYKDGTKEVLTLESQDWSRIRKVQLALEAYDDPPEITPFGAYNPYVSMGDPELRVQLRGGLATYTRTAAQQRERSEPS